MLSRRTHDHRARRVSNRLQPVKNQRERAPNAHEPARLSAFRMPPKDYAAIGLKYAQDICDGVIPACNLVKLCCKRHLDDLAKPLTADWPYKFDEFKANRFCRFCELLPHVKGKWDTRNIVLQPWQCFIFGSIFGWVEADTGLRRFRKALVVVPARNSKSTCAAMVALYMLALDGEVGAEVVCSATSKSQARIVFDVAHTMVERTPAFRDRFGVQALSHAIVVERDGSSFKPVSREAKTLEGINASCVVVDELAASANTRSVFDVLDERTGSRKNPLTLMISTEGDSTVGPFSEQTEYGNQVVSGLHDDPSYFSIYYSIDKDVEWHTPLAWRMANPNFGVSVYEADMVARCRRALKNPASAASFKTKRLNVRVGAGEAYFNLLAWRDLCFDPDLRIEDFEGKSCIIGLDLASKNDIAAKIYLFPAKTKAGAGYAAFGRFYFPEERINEDNPNWKLYRGWADTDRLFTTPGDVLDFDFLEEDLLEDKRLFKVREVAYDPDQATQLSVHMRDQGLEMVEVPQRWRQLSEPMKEMALLIETGRLRHDGDPVLTWMIGNVFAKTNVKEDVYPRKARPENKIDGAVACMFALNRSITLAVPKQPVYERRGMRFL